MNDDALIEAIVENRPFTHLDTLNADGQRLNYYWQLFVDALIRAIKLW